MTMRISDRYERFNDRVGAGKAGGPSAAGAAKTDAQSPATKTAAARAETSVLWVSVSDRAATLAAGTARLDELKAQIAKGTFKVDAKAIAKSLVGDDDG